MTTLLDRVIEGASEDAPVSQLLRQLKVLAARTETPSLEAWVEHELGGYPTDVDVPSYRGPFEVRPLGYFAAAPMIGDAQNVEIPKSTLPEEMRDGTLFHRTFREPMSTIEEWLREDHVTFGWSGDDVQMYNYLLQRGQITPVMQDWYVLAQVRYTLDRGTLSQIAAAVRTKVLDLALAVERVAPMAGQREAPAEQAGPAAAVINNHFHATANVAIGGDATQLVLNTPGPGDAEGLVRYLAAAGMPTDWLTELEEQIEEDERDDAGEGETPRWSRTRTWLARAATDTTTGALGGAIAAAAESFLA